MNPGTTATANSTSQYHLVIFRLDRQVYGLTIDQVVQIIPMVKITPLPQMDQMIEGVINMRGKVAPVISVRRSLGLSKAPLKMYTPIILAQLRGHLTGLIVDEVLDVQSFSADQVVLTSEIVPDWMESSPVLEGLVYLDGLTILLINPEFLLQPVQIQSLLNAIPQGGERKRGNNGHHPPASALENAKTPAAVAQPAAVVQPTAVVQPAAVAQPATGVPPAISFQPEVILPVTSARAAAEPAPAQPRMPVPPPPALQPVAVSKSAAVEQPASNAPRKTSRGQRKKVEDRVMQHFNDLSSDIPPADSR